VAALYEERGELTKLRKTYERIAAIDPSEQQNLRRIQETERRSSRPARSILAPTGSLAWSCAAAVLILGVFWLVSMELMARRAWALVEPDMRKCMDAGEFHRARRILEDLAHRYPVSTVAIQAASQAGGLSKKEMVRDEERRKNDETEKVQFGSFLARIETLMMAKRYVDAITLVEETNRLALGPESRKKFNSVESEIRGYFSSATELLRQARDLVGAERHEEGHKLYLKLLMNYASTPAAQGLKLPLLVKSAPLGATVTLNGEAAGVTPMTIQYNPLAKFSIALSKNGFKSALFGEGTGDRKPIDFTKDWMISVRLERIPAWIFDAKAPVDCTPLIQGGRAYIGTRGGRIFCLELATGSQIWGYNIPDGWDVSSGLQIHKDRLLFGTFDGSFHILNAGTGSALQRLVPTTPPRPIRHPSSEPTEGGLVAINCGGAIVAGLNVVSGAIAWTFRPPSEALGTPEIQGGRILCATADGTILLIDPVQGTEAGRIAVGSRLDVPGRTAEGSYIVGDSSGRIRSLLLATGAVQWTYESPLENPTPAAIGGGLVFFGSKAGLLAALDIRSGDLRWKGKVGDAILAPPAWANGNFYLGTKGGQALCLDGPSGTPEWSYMAAGSIAASPAGAEKFVLFGSDDHRLYAFSE